MRFAFFSPPLASHLAVHGALADALAARGHECFLIHHPGVRPLLRTPALGLAAVDPGRCDWSPESVAGHLRHPGLPFGVLRLVRDMAAMTGTLCEAGPALLGELRPDGIVADQMESAGALLAEAGNLPFVTVAAAMPVNREPDVPLAALDWPYEASAEARRRNRAGERIADWLTRRLDRTVRREAERLGCAPKRRQADCLSPLAEICQLVPGFDFPRQALAPSFHYVGPLRAASPAAPKTLPAISPDRPFAFMSLGTLQGHRLAIFQRVAQACRRLGVQLLAAHCGGLTPAEAASVGADWVVDRVAQDEAVARADLVITHAGLNTVMDALQAGKPMLCLPLAFDQPGLAARVKRLGAGEALSPRAGVDAIGKAIARLLGDPGHAQRACGLRAEFAAAGGATAAAAIIEQAVRTRRPVLGEPRRAAA